MGGGMACWGVGNCSFCKDAQSIALLQYYFINILIIQHF